MPKIECILLADMTPAPIPQSNVICLGNFDGVHLAHRKLLQLANAVRKKNVPHASCSVFCFREPSSDYLSSLPRAHLSTLRQKLEYFREEGVEYVFLADFSDIQHLSPAEFSKLLQDTCNCTAAVCGYNYRFGKNGAGTADMLSALLQRPVTIQGEICSNGQTVSSTRIRRLLMKGNVEEASELLTRPYSFIAKVVHGKSLGKKLDAPTINQFFPKDMLIPCHGVYITECEFDGQSYLGVSNVGVHPTVDKEAFINCETYLLNFKGDLYEKEIKTSFLKFLRPEQKFENAEALRTQIQTDISIARSYKK